MKKTILAIMLATLVAGCNHAGPGYHKPNTPAQIAVGNSVRAKVIALADTPEIHAKQLEGYVVLQFKEGEPTILRTSGWDNVDREGYAIAKQVAKQMTPEERSYDIVVGVLFEVKRNYKKADTQK